MRKCLILTALAVLCCSTAAFAGVPDPTHSSCALKGQVVPCQFRFRADGGLDVMTVCVTLRDAFDNAVVGCTTTAGITLVGAKPGGGFCPNYAPEGGAAFCTCCPNPKTGVSNAVGAVAFIFSKIGGRGDAVVCVTTHCVGTIEICCLPFHFTSPDLNGSCNAPPNSATTVVDLGLFAGCLPPSPACKSSDYNCSCTVTVLDLGLFGGGLGVPCDGTVGCP